MNIQLEIQDVCSRSHRDGSSLSPQERLVYLLADLETLKDMEGWDHFFMTDRMVYYRDLIAGLEAAGDSVSVEILRDYENHFTKYGVAFEDPAIREFFCREPEALMSSCRDWESEFESAKETRWNKVKVYLMRCGYTLVD